MLGCLVDVAIEVLSFLVDLVDGVFDFDQVFLLAVEVLIYYLSLLRNNVCKKLMFVDAPLSPRVLSAESCLKVVVHNLASGSVFIEFHDHVRRPSSSDTVPER